jgi:pilus assembly protein TadC
MWAALMCGLAVAVLAQRPPTVRRLGALLPAVAESVPAGPSAVTRQLACVVVGLVVWWVVGGLPGLVLAALAAVGGPHALARLDDAHEREEQELARQLPLALDLVAACLAGGGTLVDALRAVSRAIGGPCGARLGRVAAALSVGTPPERAFGELGESGASGSAARALRRAADGGIPVAGAVARIALDSREHARTLARRRARRAGVLAAAPLTTCFLPAFLLLGIVPCVIGVVSPLLRTL